MTLGRGSRLSRSQLPDPVPHHPHRAALFQALGRDRRPAAGAGSARDPALHAAGRLHHLPDHQRRLAPRRRPWRHRSRSRPSKTWRCSSRPASRPSTAPTSTPASRSSSASSAAPIQRSRSKCRSTPSSSPTCRICAPLIARYVERIIDRSLQRLGMERLDLVQFHWWDLRRAALCGNGTGARAAAARRQDRAHRRHQLRHSRTSRDSSMPGVPVVSHQLQYSLLDNRPDHGMVDYCRSHNIALLCYGTVAGGFLSERWLGQARARATAATSDQPLADQVQAHHR